MPNVSANPRNNPGYQPSPPVNRTYGNPVPPTVYDQNWQLYNDLTPSQVAWFQAQPEWQNFLSYVALSPATATAATPVAVVNSGLQSAGQIPVNVKANGPIV